MSINVLRVQDDGYYSGEYTSGSCVKVTVERENSDGTSDYAQCGGILIWEEEYLDNDLFDEWVAMALGGEEGYKAVLMEEGKAVYYNTSAEDVQESF